MKFSFFKAAVKFAYFVLALSKVRWLESPLETNFNSSVSDHLEVSFGKMLDLNFTFIRQLRVPAWRSILVLAMTVIVAKRRTQFQLMAGAFCSLRLNL